MTPTTPSPISDQAAGELLPCPFCGSKAELTANTMFPGRVDMATCVCCGAQAYFRKWNRRSTAPTTGSAPVAMTWLDGEPPFPWRNSWFIAETIHGDRVVLRALPVEFSYDYKTADDTYMLSKNIKRWMQFPDSVYATYASPEASVLSDEHVKTLQTLMLHFEEAGSTLIGEGMSWRYLGALRALLTASMGGDRT